MILPRLAIRNLLGARMRTWLNVIVLSLSFVVIIWVQGFYKGFSDQSEQMMSEIEYGGGQYWQEKYDPYDALTLPDAHAPIQGELKNLTESGEAAPILVVQGTIYPNGRMITVLLKGIDPAQKVLIFPSHLLVQKDSVDTPALIGQRMAETTGLRAGDYVTVRWRDARGAFDAVDIRIVEIIRTSVQSIDVGQIWLPLQKLQEMAGLPDEATLIVMSKNYTAPIQVDGWVFRDLRFLLKGIFDMVQAKTVGASIMYAILLFLAMLAIFNTQILSVFRRRKEMGTLMALGMTRWKIVQLFTLEGALHSVLAAFVAAFYGIPLLIYSRRVGFGVPKATEGFGLSIGEKLFPLYTAQLVIGTVILVVILTTFVSFLPTRRITKLRPTDALRGKLT